MENHGGDDSSSHTLIRTRDQLIVPGKTKAQTKSEETTLTLENLLADLMGILEHLFPDPKDAPSLVVSRELRAGRLPWSRSSRPMVTVTSHLLRVLLSPTPLLTHCCSFLHPRYSAIIRRASTSQLSRIPLARCLSSVWSLPALLIELVTLSSSFAAHPQLMGHSMGAAPILAAVPLLQKKGYTVPGIIVLDVVEGEPGAPIPHCPFRDATRRGGLQLTVWPWRRHRRRILAAHERYPVFSAHIIPIRRRRDPLAVSGVGLRLRAYRSQGPAAIPTSASSGIPNTRRGIEGIPADVNFRCSLHSSSIRNATSARVSVPSYLTPSPDETDPGPQGKQVWRTDLLATEPYWAGERRRFIPSHPSFLVHFASPTGVKPTKHPFGRGCSSGIRCCWIDALTRATQNGGAV